MNDLKIRIKSQLRDLLLSKVKLSHIMKIGFHEVVEKMLSVKITLNSNLMSTLYLPSVIIFLLISLFSVLAFAQPSQQDELSQPSVSNAESDLLRLESRFIGDKEQPLVSYIVPWQGTGSPDDLKWKIERKNDDTLSLVDRDIMLRSMNIYNEMSLEK